MNPDPAEGLTESEAAEVFLYPSGVPRYWCGSDNDGYPSCMGDGSLCDYSPLLGTHVCRYARPKD